MFWEFPVFFPIQGIGLDVFTNAFQFAIIPYDMFVIISMANGVAERPAQEIDSLGYGGFESPDYGGNGSMDGFTKSFDLGRGTAPPCSYIGIIVFNNPDNPVQMVGHDNQFIHLDLDVGANLGGFQPFIFGDPSDFIQLHLAVGNFTEEAFTLPGDRGIKIGTRLGVIVSFQAH